MGDGDNDDLDFKSGGVIDSEDEVEVEETEETEGDEDGIKPKNPLEPDDEVPE